MSEILLSIPPLSQEGTNNIIAALKSLSLVDKETENLFRESKCENKKSTEDLCELGSALMKRIEACLAKYSNSPKLVFTQETESSYEIRIYIEVLDDANRRSGSWAVLWKIQRVSETDAEVSGCFKFHGYSWEDGNYQIESCKELEKETVSTVEEKVNSIVAKFEHQKMSYDEKLSKAIVQHLSTKQDDFQLEIGCLFSESTVEENFKKLRRILPVTKSRFKWDVAAQKQVSLLNARKSE